MTGIATSSLYHVTVGRGDPFAEQLTRIESLKFDTEMEAAGVAEKNGGTVKAIKMIYKEMNEILD